MEEIRDFYENKLGLKTKIIMRYEAYKGQIDRSYWASKIETNPKDIAYSFMEIVPG
jgi:lactoylglutathione lyase/glyoxylase I family protein